MEIFRLTSRTEHVRTLVNVVLVASKTDQNREGCTTTRVRMAEGAGVGKTPIGAFEALVELLDAHPRFPGGAHLTTRCTASGWKVITRTEAVVALRMMAASAGKNPAQFALHSGRIGEATKLAAQGMPELEIQRAGRWKSWAFMVYVRDAGEGAQKVSAALTCAARLFFFFPVQQITSGIGHGVKCLFRVGNR